MSVSNMKIRVWLLIFLLLPSCVRVVSSRNKRLAEAKDLERKGFDDTAAAVKQEASGLSNLDPYNYELEFQIIGPDSNAVPGQYYGNEEIGYEDFPRMPVSVERAIMIARPHLKSSMVGRAKLRPRTSSSQKPIIQVTLAGLSYFIIKDQFPSPLAPTIKAVRVDANTGQVITPTPVKPKRASGQG